MKDNIANRKLFFLKKLRRLGFLGILIGVLFLGLASIPKIMAGNTVVNDLTVQATSNEKIINVGVSDQNESDTKVILPLPEGVTYQVNGQQIVGVTEDNANHQLVIDWVDGQAKQVSLQFEAKQDGKYDFVVNTVRENHPVSSAVSTVEINTTPPSNSSTTRSSNNDTNGSNENIDSGSTNTQESSSSEEKSEKDNNKHKQTTTGDVTENDFDNQSLFISEINTQLSKLNKPSIGAGASYDDLGEIEVIEIQQQTDSPGQHIPLRLATLLPNLTSLRIEASQITGSIPENIGGLSKLTELYLESNNLSGSIPSELTNLINLNVLQLSGNKLSGHIPNFELNGNNLRMFDLSNNELTGEIPKGIYNMTLSSDIDNNRSDKIDLSQNYLSGIIPDEYLRKLDDDNSIFSQYSITRYDLSDNELVVADWSSSLDYIKTSGLDKNFIPGPYQSKYLRNSFNKFTVGSYNETRLHFFGSETAVPDQDFGYSAEVLKGEHSFTITNSEGEIIYQGLANSDFSISAPEANEKYTVRMDGAAFESDNMNHFVSIALDFNLIERPKVQQDIQVNNNFDDVNIYDGDKLTFKVAIENISSNSTVTNAKNTIFIPKEFEVNKDSITLLDKEGNKIDNATVNYTEGVSYNLITVEGGSIDFNGKNKVTVNYEVLAKSRGTFETTSQVVYHDGFNLPQESSIVKKEIEVKSIDPWDNDFNLRPEDSTKFDTSNAEYPALTTLTKNEKTTMIYKITNAKAPRDEVFSQFDLWFANINWKGNIDVDKGSFYIKDISSGSWKKVDEEKIEDVGGDGPGYVIKDLGLTLAKGESIEVKFTISAKTTMNIMANAIMAQASIDNVGSLSSTNSLVVKTGELRFQAVPESMSFDDSKISNRTLEAKRKDKDWKMIVEDTRLDKKAWRITAKLAAPFKDSSGVALKDSILLFRKTGQEDQWINSDSETDVFDGTSSIGDYYNVSWSEKEGPLIQVAPGTVKVGQYKGTVEWNLIDAPA